MYVSNRATTSTHQEKLRKSRIFHNNESVSELPSHSFPPSWLLPRPSPPPATLLPPCAWSCRDVSPWAWQSPRRGTGSGEGQLTTGRRDEDSAARKEGSWRAAVLPSASGVCPAGGRRRGQRRTWGRAAEGRSRMIGGRDWRRRRAGLCGILKIPNRETIQDALPTNLQLDTQFR